MIVKAVSLFKSIVNFNWGHVNPKHRSESSSIFFALWELPSTFPLFAFVSRLLVKSLHSTVCRNGTVIGTLGVCVQKVPFLLPLTSKKKHY